MTRRPAILTLLLVLALGMGPVLAWDKAPGLRELKQAVKDNPTDPQAYFNLGLKYEILGRDKEAIKAFQQAVKLKPDYAEAQYELGRLKGERGDTGQAIKDLQRAVKLKPDFSAARAGLGGEYNRQGLDFIEKGQWGKAAEAFKEALGADPQAQDAARNNLGVALASEGQYPEALEQFRQVLESDPGNPNAHYNLGVTSLLTGNKVDAFREYLILKELDPTSAGELSYLIFLPKRKSDAK